MPPCSLNKSGWDEARERVADVGGVHVLGFELRAWIREDGLRIPENIRANPRNFGWNGERDIREAYLWENMILIKPPQVSGKVYPLANDVLQGHPMDNRDRVRVEVIIRVGPALTWKVNRSMNVDQVNATDHDVLYVTASSQGGLQLYAICRVINGNIIDVNVSNAARHLAANCNRWSIGCPEFDPSDVNVIDWLTIGNSEFIPATLQSNGVVANCDFAVFNPHTWWWIWRKFINMLTEIVKQGFVCESEEFSR